MGVFMCADDTMGIYRGVLSFFQKCIVTEKSKIFPVHKGFTKSKTGSAHELIYAVTARSLPLGEKYVEEILQGMQGTVERKNQNI